MSRMTATACHGLRAKTLSAHAHAHGQGV